MFLNKLFRSSFTLISSWSMCFSYFFQSYWSLADDYRLFCGDLGNEVNDDVLSKAFSRFPSFNMARVSEFPFSFFLRLFYIGNCFFGMNFVHFLFRFLVKERRAVFFYVLGRYCLLYQPCYILNAILKIFYVFSILLLWWLSIGVILDSFYGLCLWPNSWPSFGLLVGLLWPSWSQVSK